RLNATFYTSAHNLHLPPGSAPAALKMELVNTLFASLVGTDPFTGVDITIANCKSAYWDEGIVQQLINQASEWISTDKACK
ncbi:hypothetical protein ACUOFC_25945, partial [Escherichia sp. TWPC-MK]